MSTRAKRYDGRYMLKQYVAVVRNSHGQRFRVFKTGEAGWYLFDCLIGKDTTISGGLQFPVKASDLAIPIRRALAHGVGNSH